MLDPNDNEAELGALPTTDPAAPATFICLSSQRRQKFIIVGNYKIIRMGMDKLHPMCMVDVLTSTYCIWKKNRLMIKSNI